MNPASNKAAQYYAGRWHPGLGDPGLGDAQSAQISTEVGAGLMTIAPYTGPAAPFIAAAAGIADLVGAAFKLFSGCGQSCVLSSQYADQAEAILNNLTQSYFATPIPRPASFQANAEQSVQQILNWLQQMCSNPQLGAAGQRCISERLVEGGTAPWCPTHTGCDWITAYYRPIANDPNVVPDAQIAASQLLGSPGASTGSINYMPLLLIAAVAIGVMFL